MLKKYASIQFLVLMFLFSSCTQQKGAMQSALTPKSQVENLLNTGANSAFSIFGDQNDFLTNALIEAVMPKELKDMNSKLSQLGLNSVVTKQREIIGKIAATSVSTMKPLLSNAIRNITPAEAIAILSGQKGAATDFIRNKTENALVKSLTPTVTNELNKLGMANVLSAANSTGGRALTNIIGGLLGNKTNATATPQIETLVTNQLVNGLYNVMLDSEKKNNLISNGINSILKGMN